MSPRPPLPVRNDFNVRVTMRDGVRLAINITRPDVPGKFPALMDYIPYRIGRGPRGNAVYERLASQGYALVQYDVRGTGTSEGITTDVYQPDEIEDGVEMVHWIAKQPWCDGNVGMWGISSGAVVCWQVAKRAPEPLKAIVVRSANQDVFEDWTNPGGCPRPYMHMNYAPLMAAYNFAPPDPTFGPGWEAAWQQRLDHNVPWSLGILSHLTNDQYWRSRSLKPDFDAVKCAVYVIEGWADWYWTPLLRAFQRLTVPKKALIGPWGHFWMNDALPGPRIDGWGEVQRWFDRHLKGIDNGIDREPPVALFVREYSKPKLFYVEDTGFWRHEDAWPPTRVEPTPMYFHADGKLTDQPPTEADASQTYDYDPTMGVQTGPMGGANAPPFGMPLDQRPDEALSLCYTSAPLEQDLDLVGDTTVVLYVASTAPVAYFHVKLSDVPPDGPSMLIQRHGYNATHRDSSDRPELLEPGKIYELSFQLFSMAHRVAGGHRLRVSVTSADFQNAWPTPYAARNTLHLSKSHPSHIVLPIVGPQQPPLPPVNLPPGEDNPLPREEDVPKPEYTVTRDPLRRTVRVDHATRVGTGFNRAHYTVCADRPADVTMHGTFEMTCPVPDGDPMQVTSEVKTTSDARAFHQTVRVRAERNGQSRFDKSWSVDVPRRFE